MRRLGIVLAFALVVWSAFVPTVSAKPLRIVSPEKRAHLETLSVEIFVELDAEARPETFRAWLNLRNITSLFEESAGGMRAVVDSADGLRVGAPGSRRLQQTNLLSVSVRGNRRFPYLDNAVFFVEEPPLGDTVAPVVTAPAPTVVPAIDASGTTQTDATIANFLASATATDDVDGPIAPTHDAPFVLPLGVTTVTFSATDTAGNTGSALSTITVEDQTPPVLTPPLSITVNSPDGAPIPHTDLGITLFLLGAQAFDNVDGYLEPTHDAPLQFFPNTTTTVTFTATDSAGLMAQASAQVSVTQIFTLPRPLSGQNVNMVSGLDHIDGDPFLQRQNEPSIAVSTRNTMHILGGSNDYRTVDLPGQPDDEVTGDAWLGVFKSFDGGQKWISTLVPGFPQDQSVEGMTSPLYGFEAGADPVVRAGTGGIFFYSGLVFNRGLNQPSRIFLARFVDNNNDETGDAIQYVDAYTVDSRPAGSAEFLDKPWMAVDIHRLGAGLCFLDVPQSDGTFLQQEFPGGNVYVTYAGVTGSGSGDESAIIYFRRSTDCGVSWSDPVAISDPVDTKNQGATIAIDPGTGTVFVAWRRFANTATGETHAILLRASTDGGQTFGAVREVAEFTPFDQGTVDQTLGFFRFRTNAYPTMTVDGSGRIYVAYAERGHAPTPTADARIVMKTSLDGVSWTPAFTVDNPPVPGHQLMPSLAFAAGKLFLTYYDFRDDVSGAFDQFVDDTPLNPERHTVDVRTAMALPGEQPVFTVDSALSPLPSQRISKYAGSYNDVLMGFEQEQFNFSNLPLFRLGTAPFVGDYIDVAPSPPFVPVGDGTWQYNLDSTDSPVFQLAWTDNRDVRPPTDGDWTAYTPPNSLFTEGVCMDFSDAGMRDQNIYTARISEGLFVGSPVNTKPLLDESGQPIQRSFILFVQNATDEVRSYRLAIANQPPDAFPAGQVGRASFKQFPLPPYDAESEPPVTQILVLVPPRSSIARTVYVSSTERLATIRVDVIETGIPGTSFVPKLQRSVLLNPDLLNPDLLNPDLLNRETHNVVIATTSISNPDLLNPDLLNPDLLNPDLLNPDLINPDLLNPDLLNPDLLNPDLLNPDLLNPDLLNPDLINPDLLNPDLINPDLLNSSLLDLTFTITNTGNTTTTYSFVGLLDRVPLEEFKYQLLVYKKYTTPFMDPACNLVEREHHELVANVTGIRNSDLLNPDLLNPDLLNPDLLNPDLLNPDLLNPDLLNPDLLNPDLLNAAIADGTFYLEPGQELFVTLRVMDPDKNDGVDFEPDDFTPIIVSQTTNTEDAAAGFRQPPIASPPEKPLSIFTPALPQATLDVPYRVSLLALGADGAVSWSQSGLPTGLALDSFTGEITGASNVGGLFPVSVTADDGTESVTKVLDLEVTSNRLHFNVQPTSATAGQALAPAVQVSILDSTGTLVVTATDDVTLGIGTNAGGGSLSGTTTVSAVGGVATFPGVSIDRTGAGYTLLATSPGLRSTASHRFDINGTTPTNLGFVQQPYSTTALQPFSVQVAVLDSLGNIRTDATDAVALSIGANPGGGVLFGPMAANAVNGVATFTGLGIGSPGSGYTLVAAAAGLTGAVSNPFDIHAVPPASLVFVTQPSNTDSGDPVTPAVRVEIRDGSGSIVTTATNLVTIGIVNNPGGGTLSGTTSVLAVNGVATFPDLTIDFAGSGYTLGAFSAGLNPATSTGFDIISTGPAGSIVFNTNDTGPGSLRDSIDFANLNPGIDTITFDIPGPGPHTILVNGTLPEITEAVVIDGTSEPDYAVGAPSIVLDGTAASDWGLEIVSGGSAVRGLAIIHFPGDGIRLSGDGNVIQANVIGTDATGTVNLGNGGAGILVASSNNTIGGRVVLPGSILTEWGSAGTAPGQIGPFPREIEFDEVSGDIFLADRGNNRIQRFETDGSFVLEWGTLGTGPGELDRPTDLTIDSSGNVFVSDFANHRIQKFDSSGNFLLEWGSRGIEQGEFQFPWGIVAAHDPIIGQEVVYVMDRNNHRIQKFDTDGVFLIEWGSFGSGPSEFNFARGLGADDAGFLYVADRLGDRVQKFDSQGNFLLEWGSAGLGDDEFDGPSQIDVDSAGRVYVSDIGKHQVKVYDDLGNFLAKRGVAGTHPGQFIYLTGVTLDDDDNLYAMDIVGSRIQKYRALFADASSPLPNVVGFNGVAGISVISGADNAFLSNEIVGSPDAIDVSAGGPAAPVLTESGTITGFGFTQVNGSLASTPSTTFVLEFFFNTSCDTAGGGGVLMGSAEVMTDAAGDADFTVSLPFESGSSGQTSATATNPSGATSDFSACIAHSVADKLSLEDVLFSLPPATVGQPYSHTISVVGGTAPFTWSLHNEGNLTDFDLSLDASGVISGTPPAVTVTQQAFADIRVDGSGSPAQLDIRQVVFDITPDGGTIQGTVTASENSAPLSGVQVHFFDSADNFLTPVTTDANGVYTTPVFAPGTYFAYTWETEGRIDVAYGGEPCPRGCNDFISNASDPIVVTVGTDRTNIDFVLDQGASFTGTVTDEATGNPVTSGFVEVRDGNNDWFTSIHIESDGTYRTGEIPDGSYFVRTVEVPGLVDEFYDDIPCPQWCDAFAIGAPTVSVAAGGDTLIDFALAAGGSFSGVVTDQTTGLGATEGFVSVYDANGFWLGDGFIQTDGSYATPEFVAGDYFLKAENVPGLVGELHDDVPCPQWCDLVSLGTPVAATPGSNTIIDFALAPGGRITGAVTDASSGAPVTTGFVDVYDSSGAWLAGHQIQSDGTYETVVLPGDDYGVVVYDVPGLIGEVYDDHPCPAGNCNVTTLGDLVPVVAGADTGGIDFALSSGGRFSGTVTDEGTGFGVASGYIEVRTSAGDYLLTASILPDGTYLTPELPAGGYFIRTQGVPGLVDEYHDDLPCPDWCWPFDIGASLVMVSAGPDTIIDFALAEGGTFSGNVTNQATGLGAVGGWVELLDPTTGAWLTSANINESYSTVEVVPGNYLVRTMDVPGLVDELHDDVVCPGWCEFVQLGTAEMVAAGGNTVVNFVLDEGGTVSGTVTNAATGQPVTSGLVNIYNSNDESYGERFIQSDGTYSSYELPAGDVFVRAYLVPGLVDELYDDVSCPDARCNAGQLGTPVSVTVGADTGNVDFALDPGGTFSSTITNESSGLPVSGGNVTIYDATGAFLLNRFVEDGASFTSPPLPGGDYYVWAGDFPGLTGELYDDISCAGPDTQSCAVTLGTPVSISAGANTPGIDFALPVGGTISGTVTDAGTGLGVSSGRVAFFETDGWFLTSVGIQSDGTYTSPGLPTGNYYVRTEDVPGLVDELHPNLPCGNWCDTQTGTLIAVTEGSDTGGIDFALAAGGTFSGVIEAEGTGQPVGDGFLEVYHAPSGQWFFTQRIGESTGYQSVELPPGDYYIAVGSVPGLVGELYDDVFCPGAGTASCDVTTGAVVSVSLGADTGGIDFILPTGGTISGTVTNAGTGAGVTHGNARVEFFTSDGFFVASIELGPGGTYTSPGLPPDVYYVRTLQVPGLVDELYPNISCGEQCDVFQGTLVVVSSGTDTPNIDFALDAGGTFSGTVTDDVSGAPLAGGFLEVFFSNGQSFFTQPLTSPFTSADLPAGSYYVRAADVPNYPGELYNGVDCDPSCDPTTGDLVAITVGNDTANVDFTLSFAAPSGSLNFENLAGVGGSVSYDGEGGAAVGVSIPIETITGVATPLNDGISLACDGCLVDFTTGANTTEGPVYTWSGGGTFTLTGSIPALGIDGEIMTGTFTTVSMTPGGGGLGVFTAFGEDMKSEQLLEYFYGPMASPPTLAFTISVVGPLITEPNDGFTLEADNADVANSFP